MKNISILIVSVLFIGQVYAQTWSEQTSGVTTQLTSVSAVDDNNVWVCGYSGRVLRTTNGGANWVSVNGSPIPGALNLHNIFAVDANTALVCGSDASTYVFRTSNGGANWTQVFTQTGGFMNAIWMATPQAGFMSGDPVGGRWSLWGTVTGGLTWDSTGLYLPQAGSEAGWNNSMYLEGNTGVWFGTNNTRVYRTTNLIIWTPQATTGEVNSYSVWFNSGINGMLGGAVLLVTSNGGSSWVPPGTALPGTGSISGITGFGSAWWVTRQATQVYFSSNNGSAWSTQYTAPAGSYRHISKPRSVSFSTLWAVRTNGGISKATGVTAIKPVSNEVPDKYFLGQNYPNPFNPATSIKFQVSKTSITQLLVYDVLGRNIAALVDEELMPGTYEVSWDASNFPSGTYFFRLTSGDFTDTKKMMLVK